MIESKNQQKKEEKEWSGDEFSQEITKRKGYLEKMINDFKPAKWWKYVVLIILPYTVYWSVYMFICSKGIEVSDLFCIGGIVIAFITALLFNYMLRVRNMQRALDVITEMADFMSFLITAKVKKPLEKEKK